MCGIAGWVGVDHPDRVRERVLAAGRALQHRGPDGDALLVLAPRHDVRFVETAGARTALAASETDVPCTAVIAHRRLAILDPGPAGAQPMATADERIWIAYNGEIYNHVELREQLARTGYRFRGHCDTEVVLAAYATWGLDCLDRLAGMFAFALVDRGRGRVVLARDHLGQKPLFVADAHGGFAFASEIPALLRLRQGPVRAARSPTTDYLLTGRTDHRPETMIEGVRRLDPGTALELRGHGGSERASHTFWSVPPIPSEASSPRLEEASTQLGALLRRSVRWHLRSDVPVGSLLSGGIDSSAIVMAQRAVGGRTLDLRAVSYLPRSGAVSEELWIDMVTAAADCVTDKLRLGAEVWADVVAVARAQGEPMGSPAIVVHGALCRRAAELGIRVLLDGQGADELLAGYPAAVPVRAAGLLRRGRLVEASRLLAASGRGARGAAGIGARVLRLLLAGRRETFTAPWLGGSRLVGTAGSDERPRSLAALVRRYLVTTLPAILRWEDRNTMAVSIEGRVPFLLPELVRFCLALPDEHLVGPGGENKWVLRAAARDLVPAAVVDRRDKIGLAVPLQAWARDIPDIAARLDRVAAVPGVDTRWARTRAARLRNGIAPPRRELFGIWRLVGFDAWREALDVDVSGVGSD